MNMTTRIGVIALACLGAVGAAHAAGDAAKGQALYGTCAGCHGAAGEGNPALKSPRLAGQYDWYIAQQLRNFKAAIRGGDARDAGGKMMAPMAATLADDQAIDDVAAYIATLK